MASIEITITEVPRKDDMLEAIDFLKDLSLYVGVADGVPTDAGEDSNERPDADPTGEPVTNADLLFIHTKGSKIRNIPPRPVIEPAIENDRERLNQMLTKAIDLAFAGNFDDALQQLKLTGMRAQNVCRDWFYNPANKWPPNSLATQLRKRKKGSTDPRPLIDTNELNKSITYFVDYKGQRLR